MSEIKKRIIIRSTKALSILVSVGLFCLCWNFYYGAWIGAGRSVGYLIATGILYMVLTVLMGRIYGAYETGSFRISQLVYSQGLSVCWCALIAYVVISLLRFRLANPLPLLVMVVVQLAWSILWSFLTNKLYFAIYAPKATVVLYASEGDSRKLEEIKHFDRKFKVTRYIKVCRETPLQLHELEGAEAVFVTVLDMELRNTVAKYCMNHGAECYIQPRVGDVIMSGAKHAQMFSVPIVCVHKAEPNPEYLIFKRLFDIFASFIAIILASPFMAVTALAIKLQDGGPVLYKQKRLTRNRREFFVLKFRSMRVDAERDGVARLSTENDDRITPVGKLIRKIRFDELPQLFNILKGDMTIVGPRPERPEIAEQYEKEIPSFGLRLQVKAGLTGYAQIYGRYNTEPYDKLKMDLMYINNMSVTEDLRLMFATVKVLFQAESTEGIEEGQITASHVEEEKEKTTVGV